MRPVTTSAQAARNDTRRSAPELRVATTAGGEALAGLEARLAGLEDARSRLAAQGGSHLFGGRNQRELEEVRAQANALRERTSHLSRAGDLQRERSKKLKHVF